MTLEELEKRVRALEDLEEIKKLHRDYIFLLTNKQYEEMIDYFSENATAQIRTPEVYNGKNEIAKFFREVLPARGAPKGGQILVQPVITVEGNTAKGYWTMYRFFYDLSESSGPTVKFTQGRYDCEYIREGGKWKFSSVKYVVPWPEQPEKKP